MSQRRALTNGDAKGYATVIKQATKVKEQADKTLKALCQLNKL